MEPTLVVLAYSSAAAAIGGIGAAPLLVRERLPVTAIGWSNALAAGLMLGVAYGLMVLGLERILLPGALGALMGILFVHWTHAVSGTAELDLNRLDETPPEYGYQVLLMSALHAAAEGIAIGVAMTVSLPFGAFTALAIAVHNVPEGTVLSAIVTARGVRLPHAAGLAVATKVSQVLLAIVTFALVTAAPGLFPWALGFAAGAMVHLVLVDLMPECYKQAGSTSIALVTIVAMGIVVFLVAGGVAI